MPAMLSRGLPVTSRFAGPRLQGRVRSVDGNAGQFLQRLGVLGAGALDDLGRQ